MFTTGFPFKYHLEKQSDMSKFMLKEDFPKEVKNGLLAGHDFTVDNQNMFPIDFCVNVKAYFYHVCAKGGMQASRAHT